MNDSGIDSVGLQKQIVALEYYIDEVKSNLDDISVQFNSLKAFYVGDGANAVTSKYASLSENYETIYSKMRAYCEALNLTVDAYQKKDEEIAAFTTNNQ